MPIPSTVREQWRAAAEEDRAVRSAAVAVPGVFFAECGPIRLGPLTLRQLAKLDALRSPYLGYGSGEMSVADLVRAWLVLTDHDWTRQCALWRRWWHLRWVRKHPLRVHECICRLIEDSLADFPPPRKPSGGSVQAESPVSGIVDLLANEYGWSVDDILDMPVIQAVQLIRCIMIRHRPDALPGSRCDRVITEYLNRLNHGN